jgi:hypothetical protein
VPAALLWLRVLYGGGLLLLPVGVLRRLARMSLDGRTVRVARVLGARQLLQAALGRHPSRRGLLVGAGVDTAHAASMVAVSVWSPRAGERVLARRQARTAAVLATAGAAASASCQRS